MAVDVEPDWRIRAALEAVHAALAAADDAERLLGTTAAGRGTHPLGEAVQQLHEARRALEAAEARDPQHPRHPAGSRRPT